MHKSNTCIICNYIGNICNYTRKQLQQTAFQENMNQDFFLSSPGYSAALICLTEVRIMHKYFLKHPWPTLGTLKMSRADSAVILQSWRWEQNLSISSLPLTYFSCLQKFVADSTFVGMLMLYQCCNYTCRVVLLWITFQQQQQWQQQQ